MTKLKEKDIKVGDWVVSISKYEELEAGMVGEVCEVNEGGNYLGCAWNNFEEGHDNIEGMEEGDIHGYKIVSRSVVKVKREPSEDTMTLLEKGDRLRKYLYVDVDYDTALIVLFCGMSKNEWCFSLDGIAGLDRTTLLKVEAIMRGLNR